MSPPDRPEFCKDAVAGSAGRPAFDEGAERNMDRPWRPLALDLVDMPLIFDPDGATSISKADEPAPRHQWSADERAELLGYARATRHSEEFTAGDHRP